MNINRQHLHIPLQPGWYEMYIHGYQTFTSRSYNLIPANMSYIYAYQIFTSRFHLK